METYSFFMFNTEYALAKHKTLSRVHPVKSTDDKIIMIYTLNGVSFSFWSQVFFASRRVTAQVIGRWWHVSVTIFSCDEDIRSGMWPLAWTSLVSLSFSIGRKNNCSLLYIGAPLIWPWRPKRNMYINMQKVTVCTNNFRKYHNVLHPGQFWKSKILLSSLILL